MTENEPSLCENKAESQPRPAREEVIPELLRTADIVRRRMGGVLAPYGVTPQQYNVLRILRGAGHGGLPTLEIGERLLEETPGITRLIDRMESHGWVVRERSRDDSRQVICHLTQAGNGLLTRLDPVVRDAPAEVLNRLAEHSVRQLRSILARIRQAG